MQKFQMGRRQKPTKALRELMAGPSAYSPTLLTYEQGKAQGRIEGLQEAAKVADEYEITILQMQKNISGLENMQMVSSFITAQLADMYRAQADKLAEEMQKSDTIADAGKKM
jgi:flagellar biosynthesis/type III secretory pathway protein FliH